MKFSRVSYFTFGIALLLMGAVCCIYLTSPRIEAAPARLVGGTTVTPIATGLHNPRGLNFAPDGSLYVAEAAGNDGPQTDCGEMGDGSTKCYAETGSITRIDLSTLFAERVLTGLPSLISPDGTANGGSGPQDVSFQGKGNGYVTIGLGGDPTLRDDYFGANGANLARLLRFNPSGKYRFEEDLGGYEAFANPDGGLIDSNPYGLLALPGKVVYADAGGNALNQVSANGRITTLAVFPDRLVPTPPFIPPPAPPQIPMQAVPTTVVRGPDGDYYVGQLTGFPFPVGGANIYRVPAGGGTPVIAYSGFTNIIDIAFGPDGSLYVLEIARNGILAGFAGRLVRIAPNGDETEIAPGSLFAPGGIAIGPDGALYVTNLSVSPTSGEVLRITL